MSSNKECTHEQETWELMNSFFVKHLVNPYALYLSICSGARPILYLDSAITSYRTKLHQILSINKAVNQKGVLVARNCTNATSPSRDSL